VPAENVFHSNHFDIRLHHEDQLTNAPASMEGKIQIQEQNPGSVSHFVFVSHADEDRPAADEIVAALENVVFP